MNYHPRNRHSRGHSKKVIALVAIFFIGALTFSLLDSAILSTISPLWRAENSFSRALGNSFGFFRSKQSLIDENAALRERVSSLELEVSALSLDEAQELVLAGAMVPEGPQGNLAAILTHPPQSPYDLIVIDAGSDEGVVVGQKIVLPEGPELGLVSEVYPGFSKVKLFTTPGTKTSAVLERHQIPVELEGVGAGNFRIVVPRDTEVVVGDRVISPDLGASLLGIVEEVSIEPTDSFKEVLARSPANIFNVRFVSIRP